GRCGNGGDGLLQRFQLVVWIEGLGEWKAPDSWPDSAAKEDAYQAALSLYSCARRLQIQERLTLQIGELLAPNVLGVAVHIEAQHLCMLARGVSQQESTLVTNYLTGPFREKPEARAEFFAAI
ncbi:MAG TPA: GTP cyclohydrolase I, partial [Dehalococcoidia bacterium]|nr:GTP cyclohydrolase I [Dehalococcoidia bacterium]